MDLMIWTKRQDKKKFYTSLRRKESIVNQAWGKSAILPSITINKVKVR